MRTIACLCGACSLLVMAGCGQQPTPLPGFAADATHGQWRGMAPCADCDGIETRLVLERGGDRDYSLAETYFAGDRVAQFVDHGHWRQQESLLHLQGDSGSRRTYTVLDDGRLQASDAHGRAFQRHDAMLSPVASATVP